MSQRDSMAWVKRCIQFHSSRLRQRQFPLDEVTQSPTQHDLQHFWQQVIRRSDNLQVTRTLTIAPVPHQPYGENFFLIFNLN